MSRLDQFTLNLGCRLRSRRDPATAMGSDVKDFVFIAALKTCKQKLVVFGR